MTLPNRNLHSFRSMRIFRFFVGMMLPCKPFVIGLILPIVGSLFSAGCDKNQLSPIDSRNLAPTVRNLLVSPDSVYIDNLTPTNGEYVVSTNIQIAAIDSDGSSSLRAVTAQIIRADGAIAEDGIVLHDDGIFPDSIPGDGLYAGSAQFSLTRAQAGTYHVKVSAIDAQGAVSNALLSRLKVARRNSVPIVFNLDAPDSVTRPTSGSLLFSMTIAASDSDGLADISQVYFKSLTSSDPSAKFFLYDDGGTISRGGVLSGDQLAGDGTFSIIVQLPFNAAPGERLFAFQCQDTFGDTSAVLLHSLTVQ